jgi:DNA primase
MERKSKRPEWLGDVDARDMLEELGIEKIYDASMDELLFSCPFPGHSHGDEKPSAYMNNGAKLRRLNTVWKCHGCGKAGNAISFVAEYLDVNRTKAATWLRERYAPGYRAPKGGSMEREWELRQEQRREEREAAGGREQPIPALPWEQYHEDFGLDWSDAYDDNSIGVRMRYMLNRGFTPAEMEHWAIGYDWASDRVTIPVCTPDGALVGVKGRAIHAGRKPKYLILGDSTRTRHSYGFPPYEKSLVVFGLDEWGEQDTLVFVEGEIDVMTLWKWGIPAICTGSAHLSDEQARLVIEHCNELVIFLDNDTAGKTGIWGYTDKDGEYHPGAVGKLEPFIRVRVVGPHIWDPNEYLLRGYESRVRQLIANARLPVAMQAPDYAL